MTQVELRGPDVDTNFNIHVAEVSAHGRRARGRPALRTQRRPHA